MIPFLISYLKKIKYINCTYQQSVSKEEMFYWYCRHLPQLKCIKYNCVILYTRVHNILVKLNRQIIDVLSKNISTTRVSYCKQLRCANQCCQKNHVTNNCQSAAQPRTCPDRQHNSVVRNLNSYNKTNRQKHII